MRTKNVPEQGLGGSRVHGEVWGWGDVEVETDEACIDIAKRYLWYMPQHCGERPPVVANADPVDRADDALLDIVPDNPKKTYDMYEVIRRVVDRGDYLDIKPRWARPIITCLARLGGYPVGIVANNPK